MPKPSRPAPLALLLSAWLILAASAAEATLVAIEDNVTLAAKAELIVRGTVVVVEPAPTAHGLMTRVRIQVDETYRGPAERGGEVELLVPGGRDGDLVTRVVGVPVHRAGMDVLVFCETARAGHWTPLGLALGSFRLVEIDGVVHAERDLRGVEWIPKNAGASAEPVHLGVERIPLDVLERDIRAGLQGAR